MERKERLLIRKVQYNLRSRRQRRLLACNAAVPESFSRRPGAPEVKHTQRQCLDPPESECGHGEEWRTVRMTVCDGFHDEVLIWRLTSSLRTSSRAVMGQ
jgi:hypothetical protein